jgi:hypothetical protein
MVLYHEVEGGRSFLECTLLFSSLCVCIYIYMLCGGFLHVSDVVFYFSFYGAVNYSGEV